LTLLEVIARPGDRWDDLAERAVTNTQLRAGFRPSAGTTFDSCVAELETLHILRREATYLICADCDSRWELDAGGPVGHDRTHQTNVELFFRLQLVELEAALLTSIHQAWGGVRDATWATVAWARSLTGSIRDSAFCIFWFPGRQVVETAGTLIAI